MAKEQESKKQEVENEPIVEDVNVSEEETKVETEAEAVEAEEVIEKDDLTLALEKAVELSDKHLRLQAEFDNYRKRTLKEKVDLIKSASEKVIVNVLPVMDDFERAMANMENVEDVQAVKDGVALIYAKFESFLKQNGVAAIDTTNCDLDTDKHEAITQIPAPTKKLKGKIIDCVQKGYTLNDKVIRHSQVVMGL